MKLKEFKDWAHEVTKDLQGLSTDELIAVRKNYNKQKHSATVEGFKDASDLAIWYYEKFKEQGGKCCYCETHISVIKKIIDKGLLGVRQVKGTGVRGPKLEIERIDTIDNVYSRENCMLSCYYCNNDKSYCFNSEDYKKWIAPAKHEYFQLLFKSV